jgi:DNA methylase N-4/N-6 domain protein
MSDQINEVPDTSPNFQSEVAQKLASLFPEVIADGKIDVAALQTLLGEDAAGGERFGLFWPGKTQAITAAQTPTTATLAPDRENSVDWENTQNVVIEGDNLEVLKILQKHYYGKIKMIYIDPPYNTGNDFVYEDDYVDPIGAYLDITGQRDGDGKLSTNTEAVGRFHSNWLNMMYPRLKLARNLLSKDGCIAISIDDTELINITNVMNELFGETNRLAIVTTIVKTEGRRYGSFAKTHEYLLVYARNSANVQVNELEIPGKSFRYSDSGGGFNLRELRNQNVRAFNSNNRPNLRYPFYCDDNNIDENGLMPVSIDSSLPIRVDAIEVEGLLSVWRWGKEKAIGQLEELVARRGGDGIIRIFQKVRKLDESPKTVWIEKDFISNKGTKQIGDIFNGKVFDFPKPIGFIERILKIGSVKDSLILDFFAGSGTTAHAVMALNAEDGGTRQCISVQLPEPTDEKSEARKAGYETISEITRERIRRAGKKILEEEVSKLDGQAENLDVGFRAYKLVDTNFTKWRVDSSLDENELSDLFTDMGESANDNARPEVLLTEVLLKLGFSLTEQITSVDVDGLRVFNVMDGLAMAYLDEHTKPTLEQLRALVVLEPERLVILEDAFQGDDELKTNLVQECRTHGVDLWTA